MEHHQIAQCNVAERNFFISTENSLLQIDTVYDFLSNTSYWAKGIPKWILQRALKHSLNFAIYENTHGGTIKLVGFARAITDYSTFAYLADVFVLPECRKMGLSKWLVQTILQYPPLQILRRWMLVTRDVHKLYETYGGFQSVTNAPHVAANVMARSRPDVYQQQALHEADYPHSKL